MNLVRNLPSPRRALPVVIVIAVAVAIAAAVSIEPPQGGPSALRQKVESTSPVPDMGGAGRSEVGTLYEEGDSVTRTGKAAGDQAISDGESAPAGDESTTSTGGIAAPVTGNQPAELGLKILQDANVTLRVKRGDIDETFAAAAALARTLDGYVVSSTLSDSTRPGAGMAMISMRIPHQRFDTALSSLRDHGKFTRLQVTSQDVTQEYVDARSRLRHDQAVEARLLKLLGQTDTVSEALVIQDRLDAIQQSIEVEKGRINYLDKLTQLSTINLTIVEKGRAIDGEVDDTEWGFGEAVDQAAHRFVGNVNRAIVGFGGALPALLALALVALGGRSWMRRRDRRAAASTTAPASTSTTPEA